ncbi:NAD-dependent dihydropyrimidine dehydrogenase PreA subunit [Anaerobacterium chartisolvens]|uniref:NAD-dependent dihydropyrimidine dehydrogenase PreA subunit n=1 Tax=Anaerobacterium chartisolvens TaxID=1297424 RepID=A0A369B6X6_9FIRM|nr:nitroreductase family protein [Anaerobacterium chartisolvens]RCX16296.1 NAD-dependent dihydropyrimidine dehydrogenase PreA subunit [Anaerobacterium chartisolvens]
MSVKTARASGVANVEIDYSKCTACGLCADICGGGLVGAIFKENGKMVVDQQRHFGCIGCGQCMAICPENCISVEGRTISKNDTIDFVKERKPSYEEFFSLLSSRRAVRNYLERDVEQEKIDKIIEGVKQAPVGLPPSDVEILVLKGHSKVREFVTDIINAIDHRKWIFGPVIRSFIGLFSKETADLFETYLYPTALFYIRDLKAGKDGLLFNAPLVLYFHASKYADPADAFIAATYAMLTAEALGLATSFAGTSSNFLRHNGKLKRKYNIGKNNRHGIALLIGYPKYEYKRRLHKSLSNVFYY